MRVLIVDDSRVTRMLVKSILKEYDSSIEVLEVENGEQGVEAYRTQSPDLVFLDITMPVMDGFEALGKITEQDPSAKVVVLTADIQTQAVKRCEDLGALMIMKKLPSKEIIFEFLDSLGFKERT
jgi:CheY-like chemotaxis protein